MLKYYKITINSILLCSHLTLDKKVYRIDVSPMRARGEKKRKFSFLQAKISAQQHVSMVACLQY